MSDLLPGQKIQRLVTQAVREAYDKGKEHERERIIKLIERIIDHREAQDMVGRDKDWQGDPNLFYKLEIAKEILYLIKGEQK